MTRPVSVTEIRLVAEGTPVARVPLGHSGVTLLLDAAQRVVAVEIQPRPPGPH